MDIPTFLAPIKAELCQTTSETMDAIGLAVLGDTDRRDRLAHVLDLPESRRELVGAIDDMERGFKRLSRIIGLTPQEMFGVPLIQSLEDLRRKYAD